MNRSMNADAEIALNCLIAAHAALQDGVRRLPRSYGDAGTGPHVHVLQQAARQAADGLRRELRCVREVLPGIRAQMSTLRGARRRIRGAAGRLHDPQLKFQLDEQALGLLQDLEKMEALYAEMNNAVRGAESFLATAVRSMEKQEVSS